MGAFKLVNDIYKKKLKYPTVVQTIQLKKKTNRLTLKKKQKSKSNIKSGFKRLRMTEASTRCCCCFIHTN